jgi:hypothetical protein
VRARGRQLPLRPLAAATAHRVLVGRKVARDGGPVDEPPAAAGAEVEAAVGAQVDIGLPWVGRDEL